MTYLENKKKFFALIDEKNPNNQYFTDDEDARIKCADLYDNRYMELASLRINKKTKSYEITETGRGYQVFSLPNGLRIRILGGRNEYEEPIQMDYRIEGEKLLVSKAVLGKVVLEYNPFPTHITDETEDDFELEIDDELASILPYGVASDLFKTDPRRRLDSIRERIQQTIRKNNSVKDIYECKYNGRRILRHASISY